MSESEKIGPISPEEVGNVKIYTFPAKVFEAFNKLIARHYVGNRSVVRQSDVVEAMEAMGLTRDQIQENGWLNVEEAYRHAGWKVEYDKPGFNESYPATFTFSVRR